MNLANYPRRIGIVGNFPPCKCGIATFTHDFSQSLKRHFGRAECLVVAVDDGNERRQYPGEVRFVIRKEDPASYRDAAELLNRLDLDCVCLQHEYGIFGGSAGDHVLELLHRLDAPLVTTLHSVLESPDRHQRRVTEQLAAASSRLVVMADRGRRLLQGIYGAPPGKVDLIPHGIPDMPFIDPAVFKDRIGLGGKRVLLTFGLLSTGKGIEYVIEALPGILAEVPNVCYVVLGETHPNLLREQGETYRDGLIQQAAELGVQDSVIFRNQFIGIDGLKEYIGAADIYITPYLNPAQVTSGTLAYAYGSGRAIISTRYWHAEELLGDGSGILVPFRDSRSIAAGAIGLLGDEIALQSMRRRAYTGGRNMIWPRVAEAYAEVIDECRDRGVAIRSALPQPGGEAHLLKSPKPDLAHLVRMTDAVGIFQHAVDEIPDFAEGYCADDNARALLLTVLLGETGDADDTVRRLETTYVAFLNYAFDRHRRTLRNFMGFDRRWKETRGSDDSLGRFVWVLGTCMGRSLRPSIKRWAAERIDEALASIDPAAAPRTLAFALLGLHESSQNLHGAKAGAGSRAVFAGRLFQLYQETAVPEWLWFEDSLTYANAKIPHALLLSGHDMGHRPWVAAALESLRWLTAVQTAPEGWFRPIGSEGFYTRGANRALFGQQPIEAHATISACLAAHGITKDAFWWREAYKTFTWFLGQNDLGRPLYCGETGGCRDGLHREDLNDNQGAESLLAYLLSLQELRIAARTLHRASASDRGPKSKVPPSGRQPSRKASANVSAT